MVKYHTFLQSPQEWIDLLAKEKTPKEMACMQKAVALYPQSGTSLQQQGILIAHILYTIGLDNDTLIASLLLPGVQEQLISLESISSTLSPELGKLVTDTLTMGTLSHIQPLTPKSKAKQIENMRKMLLAIVSDVRAILIILAARLAQLRTFKMQAKEKQSQLATETLAIYAPLANRLGIWQIKWEMEDLCLRYLKPILYHKIAQWLKAKRQEREHYIEGIIATITHMLKKAQFRQFKVQGRVKHIYSIYRKMERKKCAIDAIYDINAVRILVPEISDCYAVLSLLQNIGKHIPEEFDDYISQPKPNGYRSIHTVILDKKHKYFEAQIRTFQMHAECELGMASHWQYKEGGLHTASYEAKITLLRQIMEWQKEMLFQSQALNKEIPDLFADRVYVFTPTFDIVDLPKGATPLDFAYHIHSEVGHRTRGAKVDSLIVPLTYALKTGDRVEILTHKEARPSRDWLNQHLGYLKTARARAKVQHWFRVKDSRQNIILGKEIFEKEIKKQGIEKIDLPQVAEKFNYKTPDDLFAGLGIGDLTMQPIIHFLRPQIAPSLPSHSEKEQKVPPLKAAGMSNLLTQIARCCKPLPGENIIGYVTRHRGLTVHRQNCANLARLKDKRSDQLVDMSFAANPKALYPVDLQIQVIDRAGILRDLTTLLAQEGINVLSLRTQKNMRGLKAKIYLTLEVKRVEELQKAMNLLAQTPQVIEIKRI